MCGRPWAGGPRLQKQAAESTAALLPSALVPVPRFPPSLSSSPEFPKCWLVYCQLNTVDLLGKRDPQLRKCLHKICLYANL